MANWKHFDKNILAEVAYELDFGRCDSDTVEILVRKIVNAPDYEENLTQAIAKNIKDERKQKEQ